MGGGSSIAVAYFSLSLSVFSLYRKLELIRDFKGKLYVEYLAQVNLYP